MKPTHMLRSRTAGILAAVFSSAILFSCTPSGEQQTEVKLVLSEKDLIARGKYLTTIGACNDCHSPKVMTPQGPMPDTSRLLSGHPQDESLPTLGNNTGWIQFSPGLTASVGPWGISFAANLTPDDTGTGSWTFEQFETAIRKGKYKGLEGSRPLLPPMPWQVISQMSDQDLRAVFAYLKSLKPVSNLVPAPVAPGDMVVAKN